jgi:hypothetical protein
VEEETEFMRSRPLKQGVLGKRKYWGMAGFIGALAGFAAMYFWKSELWIVGGTVLGMLGGFVVALIRGSDEL